MQMLVLLIFLCRKLRCPVASSILPTSVTSWLSSIVTRPPEFTLGVTDNNTPVLILSALGQVDDRVKGLQAGGDDYLVKPFAFSELEARVDAVHEREAEQEAKTLAQLLRARALLTAEITWTHLDPPQITWTQLTPLALLFP